MLYSSIDLQAYGFCVMFVAGALAGLIYDLLRSHRAAFTRKGKKRFRPTGWFSDIAFWVSASVIFLFALRCGTDGELRFFALFGWVSGLACYSWLASPVVSFCFRCIWTAAAFAYDVSCVRPARFARYAARRAYEGTSRALGGAGRWSKRNMRKLAPRGIGPRWLKRLVSVPPQRKDN